MSGTLADSNRGRLAFVPETTFNVTPNTPTMQVVRFTSAEFNAAKESVVSAEVRSDRMVSAIMEAAQTSDGNIAFELSLGGTFDTLLEAALAGTWSTALNVSNVAVTSGNVFGATGIGTNVVVGQWIYASGFSNAANNGWHRVTAVTANAVTVATTLTVAAADPAQRVRGRILRNGTQKRSFSFEKAFLDVGQYFLYRGQRVATAALTASAGQIVTGSFTTMGASTQHNSSQFASTLTPATSVYPVNAAANVGAIFEGDSYSALTTAIQGFSLNIDNALRNQMATSTKTPAGIGYGRQTVTGTLSAYFQNTALYQKFLNHTATALSFSFEDDAGNAMRVTLPRVYFTSDTPNIPGIDQDVMENIDWTAVLDPTTGCQIQIDMIAAA